MDAPRAQRCRARSGADAPGADAPPAPIADVASASEEPVVDSQPEHGQSEHEAEHSKWFDRAKMWAANNLYDPDEDDSVIKPEGDSGQGEQER